MAWCCIRYGLLIFAYINLVTAVISVGLGIVGYVLYISHIMSNSSYVMLNPAADGIILGIVCAFLALLFAIYLLCGLHENNPTYLLSYFAFGLTVILICIQTQLQLLSKQFQCGIDASGYIGHGVLAIIYVLYSLILCLVYWRYKEVLPSEDDINKPVQNRSLHDIAESKLEFSSLIYGLFNMFISTAALIIGLTTSISRAKLSNYLFIDSEIAAHNYSDYFIDTVMPDALVFCSLAGVLFSSHLVYGIWKKNVNRLKAFFIYGVTMLVISSSLLFFRTPISIYEHGNDIYMMALLLLATINFLAVFIIRLTYQRLEPPKSQIQIPLFQNKLVYTKF